MCRAIEEMQKEVEREATLKQSIQIAIKLIKRGKCSLDEIAEDSGLSLEDVQELAAEINAPA
jgi:predicted HTH domain antitoxin